ncbi:MAG: hypothetical protein HUJ31_03550 [Pseudomonadales bacterium]|nr:hypothetical protein [Pseudomonadales bacterium]
MSPATNKLRIITLATVFNLFFEYAVGGINRMFERPLTLIVLFFIYFCFFTMLEDLIRRFRLSNLQIFVCAWVFGIFPELYLTGSIFTEPLILGINWVSFLTINIVWWGCLQSLVTLYFANRIVPRQWDEPYLHWSGWALCITYIGILCIGSILNSPTLRRGPLEGYIVATAFQLGGLAYLVFSIRRQDRPTYAFKANTILDCLAFGTIATFFIIGTLVAGTHATLQEGNMLDSNALLYASIWNYVVFGGVIVYYARERKPITA